jgi:hypothetical protein
MLGGARVLVYVMELMQQGSRHVLQFFQSANDSGCQDLHVKVSTSMVGATALLLVSA